jgi:hypothetical protein
VSPKGLTKNVTGATAAGMVGGIAGRVVADRALQPGGAPAFGNIGYVVATAADVVIAKGKTGMMKPKVTNEIVASRPRAEIASVGLDPHMLTATLTIAFADGDAWTFEVPKAHRAGAQRVVQVLTQPVT